jgi:hypothetical protein
MTTRRGPNESGGPPAGEPPRGSERWPIVSQDGAAEVATTLAAMGFRTIPVKPRGKAPAGQGWQLQDTSAESIPKRFRSTIGAGAQNVGILLDGMLDGRHVVDIDLDDERALAIADEHLPPTACEFGREGAPRSHRLYLIDAPSSFAAWRMPSDLCPVELDEAGVERRKVVNLVEHRHGPGKQTVAPGSIHHSGEVIRWDALGAPTKVAADDLFKAVQTLAEAVIERERIAQSKQAPRLADAQEPEPQQRQRTGAEQRVDIGGMAQQYSEQGAELFRGRLRAHGWAEGKSGHDQEYWVRPGKDAKEGHSASLKQIGERWVFRCYSSSAAPFVAEQALSIFDAFALLDHSGDAGAAAVSLLEGGFGEGNALMQIVRAGAAARPSAAAEKTSKAIPSPPATIAEPDDSAWGRVRREADALLHRRPFPIEAIPEPLRSYAAELARSTTTPVEMSGLGLLVAAAAAIGSSTVLSLKRGWQVPSILWGMIALPSGSMKSPIIAACGRWAGRREAAARKAHRDEKEAWRVADEKHKLAMKEWKTAGGVGDPPPPPLAPSMPKFLINSATTEAIVARLASSPRGALCAYDELGALFGGMGQYKRSGDDLELWTCCYEGRSYSRERVGTGSTFVPYLGSSILGGVQPRRLTQLLGEEHLAGGFESRWLYVAPPLFEDMSSKHEVDEATQRAADQVFGGLYDLPLVLIEDEIEPRVLMLEAAAAERFHRFVDSNARARFIEHDDDHRAALAKQKGLVGRLALVLHEIAVAAGTGPKHRHYVELGTLEDAISLVEWFGEERARLFSTTAPASPVDHRAALLRWVTKRPGCTATASEVARSGPRKYRGDSEAAELSLRALAKAGLGRWQEQPPSAKGGRPTARFVLAEEYRGDESPAALGDSGGFGFASTHAGESAA